MDEKRANIYTIAQMAGVSIGTVSRVMNGKDRVAPETRERILALAEKVNFRPNAAARGLATSRTNNIMVLVSDVSNVYFAEMAKQISRHCRTSGYRMVLGDSDETVECEAEYLRTLIDGHVDGAIVAPLTTRANLPHFRLLQERGFPLVLMDTEIEGVDISVVRTDNAAGAGMAVDYLLEKGYDRIAFVSGNIEFQTNRLRFQGFRDRLRECHAEMRNEYLVLNQDFLQEEGFCGVEGLLKLEKPPTALFASSDLTAMACIRAIRRMGLRVPQDIAVVGFDDLSISAHMEIPLTTVSQPKAEIAQCAVEMLFQQMEKGTSKGTAPQHVLVQPALQIRDSA